MPVSDEYAARTVCRDSHLYIVSPLVGSQVELFLDIIENIDCKYSHTIFNTDRVHTLGGRNGLRSYVVSLHYACSGGRRGGQWNVTLPAGSSPGANIGKFNAVKLPKALAAAEAKLGLRKQGDAPPSYAKVQSLCQAHHSWRGCQRPDCKFDHNLVDSKRIENLARWVPDGFETYDALTVECRVVEGRTTWKIILKEAVFKNLKPTNPIARRIPSKPYSYKSAKLLDVVRHMERVVGIAAA